MKKHLSFLSICSVALLANSCLKNELGELPTLSFTYSNNIGTAPINVLFEASTTNAKTISWNFGDGQTATGTSITHTYATQGLFSVTATATSEEGITTKQTKIVNVSPYTQISISQILVTVPVAASFYSRIYDSHDSILKQTNYVFTSLSANDTILPPVVITDFEKNFKVKIMNFGTVISTFSFSPGEYFENSIPFPTSFLKNDVTGRTVLLYVSWN